MDHSNAHDHRRMAQLELSAATRTKNRDEWDAHLRCAHVHATLAVADAIRALAAKEVRDAH